MYYYLQQEREHIIKQNHHSVDESKVGRIVILQAPHTENERIEWKIEDLGNSRTPYDENEIIGLLEGIVRNVVRLSDIPEEEILWAPEGGGGHVGLFDDELAEDLNVSPLARSLMRKLPYRKGVGKVNIVGTSTIFAVDDDGVVDLRGMREDTRAMDQEQLLWAQDVVLAAGEPEDCVVVLDTVESTIGFSFFPPFFHNDIRTPPIS